jgi:hypothetical protein
VRNVPSPKLKPAARAYELDMIAPLGASGSPLFRPHPLEVVGVVYGEQDVQMGGGRPITFAYALHLSTLREARGAATQGKPFHEFLADQHRLLAEQEQAQDPEADGVEPDVWRADMRHPRPFMIGFSY